MKSLPVATRSDVREEGRRLLRQHRAAFSYVLVLYSLATVAGLVAPWLIGHLTTLASTGQLRSHDVTVVVVGLLASSLSFTLLTFGARRASYRLGETVFAQLREEFLASVLRLPLATVESAGTGDLLSRTTGDLEALSRTVRFAVPEWTVALIQVGLTVVALILVSPLVAVGTIVAAPLLWSSTKRYLAFAVPGYIRERVSYATTSGTVSETVDGSRTVEALRLSDRQRLRIDGNIRESFYAETYTLLLRMRWFPAVDFSFALAVAGTLVWGGTLALHHVITLGAATAATLYAVQLSDPLDRVLSWLDELQIGQTALARLVGVNRAKGPSRLEEQEPHNEQIEVRHVTFSYRAGHDVLHDVSFRLTPGERLAIVGPSGAGKSTIGRLLAGIEAPSSGSVTVGGVELSAMPLEKVRQHVALVTQEHHVFLGTLRDNLLLAKPTASTEELWRALTAVDAAEWAAELDGGLDTELGDQNVVLSPSQSQQVALARLVLVDPHTLVLDEATALLDPRAARHLERSLNAVLQGRTVVAIAHRLQTAHDADRVAVVDQGRIVELGTHDELLALNGQYAELWRTWRNERSSES